MIKEFNLNEKLFKSNIYVAFDYDFEVNRNNMVGCKVEIYELQDPDKFDYTQGVFMKMHNHKDKVISLFDRYSNCK